MSQEAAAIALTQKTGRSWNQKKVQRLVSGAHASPPRVDIAEMKALLDNEGKRLGIDLDKPELQAAREPQVYGPAFGLERESQIAVYGAGADGSIKIDDDHVVDQVQRLPAQGLRASAYAVEAADDLMAPRYEPGERAFVLPGRAPRPGEDALFVMTDGTARLLRYVKRAGGVYFARTFTPDAEEKLPYDRVQMVHAIARP